VGGEVLAEGFHAGSRKLDHEDIQGVRDVNVMCSVRGKLVNVFLYALDGILEELGFELFRGRRFAVGGQDLFILGLVG
jgi:hypothetical protein